MKVERESRDAMGSRQNQYRGLEGTMQAYCRYERHKGFEKFLRGKRERPNMRDKKNGGSPAGPRSVPPASDGDNNQNYGIEFSV
jgi:hypothetical protein